MEDRLRGLEARVQRLEDSFKAFMDEPEDETPEFTDPAVLQAQADKAAAAMVKQQARAAALQAQLAALQSATPK